MVSLYTLESPGRAAHGLDHILRKNALVIATRSPNIINIFSASEVIHGNHKVMAIVMVLCAVFADVAWQEQCNGGSLQDGLQRWNSSASTASSSAGPAEPGIPWTVLTASLSVFELLHCPDDLPAHHVGLGHSPQG